MQPLKLARVRWQVGQTLLPAHFETQEQALAAEARVQAGLSGLPQFGIASLEVDPDQLLAGVFSVKAMTALTPGGFLVDVPGNARAQEYDLKKADRSKVTLYLYRLTEPEEDEERKEPEQLPPDADLPPRVVHRLVISPNPPEKPAQQLLELATLERVADTGKWSLSAKEAPPLLQVGSNPFLDVQLARLDTLLLRARGELRSFLGGGQGNLLRKDQLTNARRAYCEVRSLQAMREDMLEGGIHPHPYVFFAAVRRLYFELCCYRMEEPTEELPAYRHPKPGATLAEWLTLFERHLHAQHVRPTFKRFERQDARLFIELGEEHAVDALTHHFFLLVKRKEPHQPRSLEKVKLASPDRLGDVRRMALKGIPLREPSAPGFPHDMPMDVDWHQLKTEGEEWKHALRKNGLALALFVTPALEDAEVSLFWRSTT